MKIITLIVQIALLYVFYYTGVWLQQIIGLPVPGSVIGFFLLFAALIFKLVPLKWIEAGAGFLQAYLPLLFVPATVGVMNYFGLFAGKGVLFIFIIVLSTVIVLVVSGHTSQFLAERTQKKKVKKKCRDRLQQSL